MNVVAYIKDFVAKNPGNDGPHPFWALRSDLFKKYIRISYESLPNPFLNENKEEKDDKENKEETPEIKVNNAMPILKKNGRIILTSVRSSQMHKIPDNIHCICNGLILELNTWKVLCYPLPAFQTNINTPEANQLIKENKLDIYEIEDGTMINLYYYDAPEESKIDLNDAYAVLKNKWKIATVNGFEVNNTIWNTKTYQEILEEVLDKVGIDKMQFYQSLDPSKTYSMIFKHPEFHPFYEGKGVPIYRLICAGITENATGIHSFNTSPMPSILMQKKLQITEIKDMKQIYKNLTSAIQTFDHDKTINYGYIMRNHDGNQYMLESNLLNAIRRLYYDKSYTVIAKKMHYIRDKYICINAFLDRRIHTPFIKLFPQYKLNFDDLNKLSKKIINDIIKFNAEKNREDITDSYKNIIGKFIINISKIYTITPTIDCVKAITSYIIDPANVDTFYKLA
jgi:hypothetical protein